MKDFDLETEYKAWEELESIRVQEMLRGSTYSCCCLSAKQAAKHFFNKAKELYDQQFAELKQEYWDAAREQEMYNGNEAYSGASDLPISMKPINFVAAFRNRYKDLEHYESKRDGQDV